MICSCCKSDSTLTKGPYNLKLKSSLFAYRGSTSGACLSCPSFNVAVLPWHCSYAACALPDASVTPGGGVTSSRLAVVWYIKSHVTVGVVPNLASRWNAEKRFSPASVSVGVRKVSCASMRECKCRTTGGLDRSLEGGSDQSSALTHYPHPSALPLSLWPFSWFT